MSISAYPLQWPAGWPRTPSHKLQDSKYRFRRTGRYSKSQSPFWTFAEARNALNDELDRLGARNLVLSSNFDLRLDGQPSAKAGNPHDRGIAIYFTFKGKQMVMACDAHVRAEENMRSLTLAIEAMRQLERHGGGVMMERAFEGFQALPAPGAARPWRDVLEFREEAILTRDMIDSRFRRLATIRHPDRPGGSHDAMAELNAAKAAALKEIG
jgi:hypothetical protein